MAREQAVPGNPWVAVRPGDDVALLARRLSSAHQSFIDARGVPGQGLTDDSHVRSVVLESWMRSRNKGVNPDVVGNPEMLEGLELEKISLRASHVTDPSGDSETPGGRCCRDRTTDRDQ